jgi:hypothetical protein
MHKHPQLLGTSDDSLMSSHTTNASNAGCNTPVARYRKDSRHESLARAGAGMVPSLA